MYDVLSDAEIERQDIELLPARTVLSLTCYAGCGSTSSTTSSSGTSSTPSAASTTATPTAASTTAAPSTGGPTFNANTIVVFFATNVYNTLTGGTGGASAANGTGAAGTSGAVTTPAR